jgi:hypothetical protein
LSRFVSRSRGWIAVALAVQLILALWALDAIDLFNGSNQQDFVPVAVSPSPVPIDIESGYSIAFQHAQQWSSSARLVAAVMRLEWPSEGAPENEISLPDGGWLVFTFADGEATLSIYLDRRTLPTIDLSAFTRSSATAALTAELLHGAAYRTSCPGTRTTALVTPSLMTDVDGAKMPIWTVTYADARFADDFDVLVQLDANSGNVVTSEANERPCERG